MKIEKITVDALDEVLEMQEEIYEKMEVKEALERIKRDEMETILSDNYSVGVYADNKLVAMRGFYIPKLDEEEHLADDVGVDRSRTIYSEIALVHPIARGEGLQFKMGKILLEDLKKDDRFDHLIATVMPLNIPSLKNSLRIGLKIVNTKFKYGGKRRHILHMNLKEDMNLEGEPIEKAFDDFEWMLENGKDYIGTEFVNGYITYYKKG
ncbi:N-acetyltransferase [Phocicoccus pinnipedialis]|uniref:N-acetyltransferase domain-containing protein n=1 Tax=Phocicoccus pinnipedialis TaxID=110845 RepID=A0A6V7RDP6_9BACL|nr:N-acetyltransferase [Jeotgalicoccus pinnipedialis]MBP1939521.1 RimJ/RimL family protein N-acetyltransferase [Jeotgalicoccus pinnipedialis]CAD2075041.1 hypothetical protein JEOPIN946_00918 [Jeotgalicoccus pinnipedialis]